MDEQQRAAIAAPTFETALRAKARSIIESLESLDAEATPVTFDVDEIPVEMAWGDGLARITVVDNAYSLRVPLDWITADPS